MARAAKPERRRAQLGLQSVRRHRKSPATQVAGTMKENALLRNTLLYLPAQLLGPALQFAVTVIWTHLFDPALFGVVTFVVATRN